MPSKASTLSEISAQSSPTSPTARRKLCGRAHPPPLTLDLPQSSRGASAVADHRNTSGEEFNMRPTPPITPQKQGASESAGNWTEDIRSGDQRAAEQDNRALDHVNTSLVESDGTLSQSGQQERRQQEEIALGPQHHPASDLFPRPPRRYSRRPSDGKGVSVSQGTASNSLRGRVGVSLAGAGSMASSRYLLTVIPPSHLPHDPPHPKSNPNCSGYGPPEHFRWVPTTCLGSGSRG